VSGAVGSVVLPLVAAGAAALVPPWAMVAIWAGLSGDPLHFLAETGADGMAAFVLSQQRFFLPVALAGLGAHGVLLRSRRQHPLVYVFSFYCIGAVVYLITAGPQLVAFRLDPPVLATLAGDALLWSAPAAALSGLIFWLISIVPRRRARP
jgi:hypothetical protein